jgi:hypothetical protein
MIDNITVLPEVLRTTDFKVFEGMWKIVSGSVKADIDNITNLKDWEYCPDHILHLLAGSIGCPYFNETSIRANRYIIKNWWTLMKQKGTISSFILAVQLALLAYFESEGAISEIADNSVDIISDPVTGITYIRVSYESNADTALQAKQQKWINKLLEYVRPAGSFVTLIPSTFVSAFLSTDISHDIKVESFTYSSAIQSAVGLTSIRTTNATYNIATILNELNPILTGGFPDTSKVTNCLEPHFGLYNSNSTVCAACAYKTQCEIFSILGLGAQEVTTVTNSES